VRQHRSDPVFNAGGCAQVYTRTRVIVRRGFCSANWVQNLGRFSSSGSQPANNFWSLLPLYLGPYVLQLLAGGRYALSRKRPKTNGFVSSAVYPYPSSPTQTSESEGTTVTVCPRAALSGIAGYRCADTTGRSRCPALSPSQRGRLPMQLLHLESPAPCCRTE